jgi:hypothetical protein
VVVSSDVNKGMAALAIDDPEVETDEEAEYGSSKDHKKSKSKKKWSMCSGQTPPTLPESDIVLSSPELRSQTQLLNPAVASYPSNREPIFEWKREDTEETTRLKT